MMRISLNIINDQDINPGQKLLFRSEIYDGLLMLYDDGADVSVCTLSEDAVIDYFPDAKKTDFCFVLSGFGRGLELTPVYRIDEFVVGHAANGDDVIIKNFYFAVSERPEMSTNMILAGNIANNATTTIVRKNGRISMDIDYYLKEHAMGIKQLSSQAELEQLAQVFDVDITKVLCHTYCFTQENI